ncbi:hypothetical protein [Faecalibacterium prausnitzii]
MRKKKIKILHVAQAAGGVDRYIRMLLKYLDAVTWFDVSENENAIANMIDLTKVPEETRYIRNREVAENGYDMQETANRLMKIYLSLIGE